MSSGIKTYPSTTSGVSSSKEVTGSDVGTKRALDIAVQDSVIASAGSVLAHSQTNVAAIALPLPAVAAVGRKKIVVQNLGAVNLFLGTATVTTATGLRVSGGSNITLELSDAVTLYGISTAAGADVRVLEIG